MPDRHLKAVPDQPDQPALVDEREHQPHPTKRVCSWCSKPAVTQIMIMPPLLGMRKGRRILKKEATWAPSCREHRRLAYDPLTKPVTQAVERRRLELAAKDQMTISDMLEEHDPDEPGRPAS